MTENKYIVRDTKRVTERPVESRAEAEEVASDLRGIVKQSGGNPECIEIISPEDGEPVESGTDGGAQIVEHATDESFAETDEPTETHATPDMAALAANPIEWLEGVNDEYVNTIKGTPAISKRGFRYIQSQFGITTESELVTSFEDPLGVVVWARAELPDGRAAEAHGEGYRFEPRVDDNEFVRYADSRAKSRALSDLTSAGALATSEMGGKE